ncbi:hypothetical protein PLICRDRAFT_171744 [Plicaturopsis crispa FD-325 SS-3]|nr:hypothetical protein PLICRDRAFT_171744 [Plicaturopsis crispa FD-325 SS-3]
MPGIITPKYTSTVFYAAADLPSPVWSAFRASPEPANVMFPFALKALAAEREGRTMEQVWIVCSTDGDIDFVLSCYEGPLGAYPVFIFAPHSAEGLEINYMLPRIWNLVRQLHLTVSEHRVFSVFAPERVANIFAGLWTEVTGIYPYPEPYYAAKLTYCTLRTLPPQRQPSQFDAFEYDLRLATEADIPQVAQLCLEFASTSEPFILNGEQALEEATMLVKNKQVWVHRVQRPGQRPEIASIVAVTRHSGDVAAITKVCTNPNWRKMGCAARLVRYVCKHLLSNRARSVVLYVAHDNHAARHVYGHVGFVGLRKNDEAVEGVSDWVEIGFDRSRVQLGHW